MAVLELKSRFPWEKKENDGVEAEGSRKRKRPGWLSGIGTQDVHTKSLVTVEKAVPEELPSRDRWRNIEGGGGMWGPPFISRSLGQHRRREDHS